MAGTKSKGKSMGKKCTRYKNEHRREANKAKKLIKEAKRQARFAKYREARLSAHLKKKEKEEE